MLRRFCLAPVLGWLPAVSLLGVAGGVFAAVDFSHEVVPVLKKHCAECHAGDKKKGGFSFNTREALMEGGENGAVVVAGKAEKSRLIEVILSQDTDEQMPPKGPRLSPAEVEVLRRWVAEDLPWQEGFAFQKPAYEPPLAPREPVLPPAVDGRTHPVDRVLDAWLAKVKRARPAPLDDAAFLRRVSLDLTGLLPTVEETRAFLADASPEKRAVKIRALLADETRYAEHWLTFWNDLLRNDYGGTGFITGGRRQISGWLYRALVDNMPADQFVRELIAPPTGESRGFIDGIKWRGDVSAGQTVEIQFAQSVSQSFLGINMKCASCHDSFIDRWKLDEAYSLAAVYSTRPLEIARCDKGTGRMARAGWLFPELGQVNAEAPQPERLKQLAALMTHPGNGRFTRTLVNRFWQRLMGRGIVHPVDAMQTEPWNADLLDLLATHLAQTKYDMKSVLELITTSQAYQSRAQIVEKGVDDHGYVYAGPRTKRLTAEAFVDAVWQITGTAPLKMDAPVLRGKADPAAAKKVKLSARWIWGPSAEKGAPPAGESLLFRKTFKLEGDVLAAGAVVTCDNEFTLYVNGREVVGGANWEALTPVALGPLLKSGANTIVIQGRNAGNGPNAAGLFFEARVRLADDKEIILATDETWQVSSQPFAGREGRLGALKEAGWQPAVLVRAAPVWDRATKRAPEVLAQAAFLSPQMVRAALLKSDLLMRSLGRPNRDQIVTTRPDDLTTLEAMDLANGAVLTETLARGAKNLLGRPWPDTAAFTRWLYVAALCREATAQEVAAAEEIAGTSLSEQGAADLLWAVFMLPEFQRVW